MASTPSATDAGSDTAELRYLITNKSGSSRSVYLELGFVDNARVAGADRLEYDSGRRRGLAVFEIAARSERKRELRADEGLSRRHEIARLSSRALRRFASSPKLASAQKPILERAAERLIEAEVREAVIPKRQAELLQVERDIVRLRENVRALGRSRASAAQRIAERLLAAEDRGRALRVRIAELRSEALERRGQAKAVLAALGGGRSRG